ncbi:MAG: hypothetical protein LBJ89_00645 [Holosporales bacterium]|jgi:hypothetical protein|nr:hypothetical protein [Holosporales bacterium]
MNRLLLFVLASFGSMNLFGMASLSVNFEENLCIKVQCSKDFFGDQVSTEKNTIPHNWAISLQNWQVSKKTKVYEIFVGDLSIGDVNAIPCGAGTYSLCFSPRNYPNTSVYTTGKSDYKILIASKPDSLSHIESSFVDNLSDGQEEDLFLVQEDGSFDLVQIEE